MTDQQKVVADLIKKFPKSGNKTLSRIAYKNHPLLFSSENAADLAVRRMKGASGEANRKKRNDTVSLRGKSPKTIDAWADFPDGIVSAPWEPIQVDGPVRCLVLSDIHIPYHDKAALKIAIKYGKENGANVILLNGDIVDCYSISRYEKDPEQRNFANELQQTRHFLSLLRKEFPKARIIFKLGNHEERYEKFLFLKAPEFLGISDFRLQQLLHFDEFKIELVKDQNVIRLGKLNVLHGHEYRFGVNNPVNAARGYYNRAKAHVLAGHLHVTSNHKEKNLEGHVVSTWSTGALCEMHPAYHKFPNWNLGFAFVVVGKDGAFRVSNLTIIDGETW